MASAELIAIGTELLLGEIQDTNTRYLTRQLRQLGINVFRTTIIGDNPLRIAEVMNESLTRCDFVITTGGLGPTVDDPTRDAAALAFNVDVEFHTDLWDQITSRFLRRGLKPSENNRKQALLPAGAVALVNPVGTAPAFYLDQESRILICLPGVPGEMETIFQESVIPLLERLFGAHEIIKSRILHTCGMGESNIDTQVADLEKMANPTVGLSAHPGIVDIRITAKASSESVATAMLDNIEKVIVERLPGVIFGVDGQTLPHSLENMTCILGLKILFALTGFSIPDLGDFGFIETENITLIQDPPMAFFELSNSSVKDIVFGINLIHNKNESFLNLQYSYKNDSVAEQRLYNGPSSMVETWAINTSLGFLWKKISSIHPGAENGKS